MPNLFCLVCNINLNVSSCVNISYTSLSRNGELLVNFVSKVLRVAVSELHDSYVCSQCYNLFQMLEQAQKTVSNIRCEILKIYRATERRRNIKQVINNDGNLNLSTNVALEENKLNASNCGGHSKEESNLQLIQIEEAVKQQCIQDKITSQIISLPNRDCDIYVNTIINSKTNTKRNLVGYSELNNTKSFEYNNSYNDIKKNEITENDVLHNSIAIINDNNLFNISSSQGKR